jgi:hypothetical protein
MPDFIIEDRGLNGPQTHVLIIGVGHYRHFGDGDEPTGADDFGMRQLTSPVHSAKEIASWFVEHYDHPAARLGSVRLLCSELHNNTYEHPGGSRIPVGRASFDNVRTAIRAWKDAGDGHVDNILIFYFSGHGVSDGARTVLILDDYGEDDQAPLDGAFDFSQVHRAMDHCQARTQCYFIDACRVAGEDLIDGANIGKGTIVRNEPDKSIGLPKVRSPIFYSTLAGAEAYGRQGRSSFFSEAIVTGLNGAAADNTSGAWRVDTGQLLRLIRFYLERAEDRGESLEQINESDNMVDFELNLPPASFPVPVVIGCQDKSENTGTVFSWRSGNKGDTRAPPENEHWDVLLDPERYDFEAQIQGAGIKTEKRTIRPPFHKVLF